MVFMMNVLTPHVALPYSQFARTYDDAVGTWYFRGLKRAFEQLLRQHDVRFSSAADLGCGTGLFARYLDRTWKVPVFGIDRSGAMLQRAAINCRGGKVVLLLQDIRNLHLPAPVDLITANFDTLNHLLTVRDLVRTFQRVAANLTPNGHFLFDILTSCQLLPPGRLSVYRFITPRCRVEQVIRWQPITSLLLITVRQRCPVSTVPTIEQHRERAFTGEELGRALHEAGFAVRGVHDATTLAPATQCVPRLLILAQRLGAVDCQLCRKGV